MKHHSHLLTALGALLAVAAARGADLKPIPYERMAQDLPATGDAGPVRLPMREILVDGKRADGKSARGRLIVAFDPSTQLFVWAYGALPPDVGRLTLTKEIESGELLVYAGRERLVMFMAQFAPVQIDIWEAREKADSADDAERRALRRAGEQLEAPGYNPFFGRIMTSLHEALGNAFVQKGFEANAAPAKFVDISHKDGNWEIVLEDQWKERITLNEKFGLIGHKREE
jgi:hypothetical protein